jgi:hypothetical protein
LPAEQPEHVPVLCQPATHAVQVVAVLLSRSTCPAGQLVHAVAPAGAAALPTPEHVLHDVAPALEYEPALQIMQAVARDEGDAYLPAAHWIHVVAALVEYLPLAQSLQPPDVPVLAYCPAEQLMHEVLPLSYLPPAHWAHATAPAVAYWPAVQATHAVVQLTHEGKASPARKTFPAGQLVHVCTHAAVPIVFDSLQHVPLPTISPCPFFTILLSKLYLELQLASAPQLFTLNVCVLGWFATVSVSKTAPLPRLTCTDHVHWP